uniref:Uncharacterized protein n=1 Tax=Meloidogyne enterolobii TaxID=390850 RepID=A0A6V7X5M2_MELEN|nr:unnamed protein product [Meloidogyne enterolobii]
MSTDLLDILFKLDYFVCLLLGFPLNIILIILIIFTTPKEMKTHSRILLQNCVLDILLLTIQMFIEGYFISDAELNTITILPNGILISFMKDKFNPFICYIVLMFWEYTSSLNFNGVCVQFIYRYLVLNRNMKINFRRYLYIFSIALFLTSILILDFIFSYPYSFGGIKNFDNFNKTLSYIQYANVGTNMSFIPMALSEIFLYLIIIVCGFKMVRFVSLNTNLDGNFEKIEQATNKSFDNFGRCTIYCHSRRLLSYVF